MPEFEVTISYKLEYVATKTIRAKDEDTARERVEKALEKVTDLDKLIAYADSDTELETEDISVEDVTEL